MSDCPDWAKPSGKHLRARRVWASLVAGVYCELWWMIVMKKIKKMSDEFRYDDTIREG